MQPHQQLSVFSFGWVKGWEEEEGGRGVQLHLSLLSSITVKGFDVWVSVISLWLLGLRASAFGKRLIKGI